MLLNGIKYTTVRSLKINSYVAKKDNGEVYVRHEVLSLQLYFHAPCIIKKKNIELFSGAKIRQVTER